MASTTDHGAPYTIEDLNHLTGVRSHRKATKYEMKADAEARAAEKAARSQSFMSFNVLDRAGYVVATFKVSK